MDDGVRADIEMHELRSKGLRKGSVSRLGAIAIGLSATAPAYSLTGALGFGADESGYQLPIVFILSVIPMFFVALAYKHLTIVARDSGTVFTWGSKSLGPYAGWLGGWGLILSSVLAGVGAAEIMAHSVFAALGIDSPGTPATIAVAATFILLTTALVARGAEESSKTTIVLTVIQYAGLIFLASMMLFRVFSGDADPTAEPFSLEWLNPLAIDGFRSFMGGFLIALFIFWGFDASLSMSEETDADPDEAARTGITSMTIILITYVLFTIAALAFAGIDPESPTSLTADDHVEDVLTALATDALGSKGALVAAFVVGISAFSATMSTVVATARGVLAMATYRALPTRFATVDEASQSPKFATWTMGILTLSIYLVLALISESVVQDSVYSVGISICLYYVVAAFSCVKYFAPTLFKDGLRNGLERVVLPAIGGIVLLIVMVIEARHMTDPEYGSGSTLFGVGAVFVVGVLLLFAGVPLMVAWRLREPAFFKRETLSREDAVYLEGEEDDEANASPGAGAA